MPSDQKKNNRKMKGGSKPDGLKYDYNSAEAYSYLRSQFEEHKTPSGASLKDAVKVFEAGDKNQDPSLYAPGYEESGNYIFTEKDGNQVTIKIGRAHV